MKRLQGGKEGEAEESGFLPSFQMFTIIFWKEVLSSSAELNVKRTDFAPSIELSIMPLGASITYGIGSSHGNGYRLALAEDLSGTN